LIAAALTLDEQSSYCRHKNPGCRRWWREVEWVQFDFQERGVFQCEIHELTYLSAMLHVRQDLVSSALPTTSV
jgi:hypothetical protein